MGGRSRTCRSGRTPLRLMLDRKERMVARMEPGRAWTLAISVNTPSGTDEVSWKILLLIPIRW